MGKKKRKKPGLPPGSLVFTGKQKVASPDVSIIRYNESDYEDLGLQQKGPFPEPRPGLVTWFDIRGVHEVELVERIGRSFNIHPLILEDIVDVNQRPKFEEYPDGLFLVVRFLSFNREALEVQSEQVAIYVMEGMLMSFQEDKSDLFSMVRDRLVAGKGKIRSRAADYLAYALVDSVVDHYFQMLDEVEEVIEGIEESILEVRDEGVKSRIHQLKRALLVVRRSVSPLRESIGFFSRSDHPLVQGETSLFTRDLYDHIIQIMEINESIRESLTSLHDLYISEVSFRMNEIMKVLTIIGTIFIPLTFLVGVYGMNFQYMPELGWRNAYFILWGVMVVITVLLVYYFRRRKWL